ncbi:hypothetical protein [Serinicoccus sp. LYQ131]|uniref:hypothetical protein n=1 Tax=Serinicoccus sp. LYQ131 TaxID=3378797 RepID=UPI00385385D7
MRSLFARNTAAGLFGIALSLGVVGSAGATPGQPADLQDETRFAASSDISPASSCDFSVFVDRHDRQPEVYGATSLNCSGWTSQAGYLAVDFYRDGVYVGQGFCQMSSSTTCAASISADNPAGTQLWRACARYEITPDGVGFPPQSGSACSSAYH